MFGPFGSLPYAAFRWLVRRFIPIPSGPVCGDAAIAPSVVGVAGINSVAGGSSGVPPVVTGRVSLARVVTGTAGVGPCVSGLVAIEAC